MNTNILESQSLLAVSQESADQVFWCEQVDLDDKEESSSPRKDFNEVPGCGCGCQCSCS